MVSAVQSHSFLLNTVEASLALVLKLTVPSIQPLDPAVLSAPPPPPLPPGTHREATCLYNQPSAAPFQPWPTFKSHRAWATARRHTTSCEANSLNQTTECGTHLQPGHQRAGACVASSQSPTVRGHPTHPERDPRPSFFHPTEC